MDWTGNFGINLVRSMNAPRIIAALVAVFLALTALQTLCWHERLPEGWQPAWWQSRLWAHAGILVLAPAWLTGGAASTLFGGSDSVETRKAFMAVGCVLYSVAAYFIVHLGARWIAKQFASNEPKS
jgi:hypothetical protein